MKPNQLWLDLSRANTLRVWVDNKLQLAQARGQSAQRLGFFREIPLYHLNSESAHNLGWMSFPWTDLVGKFQLERDFFVALQAARLSYLSERPEKFVPPLAIELPLASDVLFYGGSFDPWHEGHASCLRLAPADRPLFICPDRNPHKALKTQVDVVDFLVRLQAQLAPGLSAQQIFYPGFLLKTEPNPTVSWVLRLKNHRPDLRLGLLLGYDSFRSLSSWTKASELVKLLSFVYVVSRNEDEAHHATDSEFITQHNDKLEIVFLGRHPYEGVSSTQKRNPS